MAGLYLANVATLVLNTIFLVLLANYYSAQQAEVGLVSFLNVVLVSATTFSVLALPLVGFGSPCHSTRGDAVPSPGAEDQRRGREEGLLPLAGHLRSNLAPHCRSVGILSNRKPGGRTALEPGTLAIRSCGRNHRDGSRGVHNLSSSHETPQGLHRGRHGIHQHPVAGKAQGDFKAGQETGLANVEEDRFSVQVVFCPLPLASPGLQEFHLLDPYQEGQLL